MKKILFMLVAACLASSVYGVEPEPSPSAESPDAISVKHDWILWYNLYYGGEDYGMAWGLNPAVGNPLKTVPSAKPWVETYQTTNLLANLTFWGGNITTVVAFGMILEGFKNIWILPGDPGYDRKAEATSRAGPVVGAVGLSLIATSIVLTMISSVTLRTAVKNYSTNRPSLTSP